MKEIGLSQLCLSLSLFIDQKGTLPSTTRHEYLTNQASLSYTETKAEHSLGKFKRKRSCSDVGIFPVFRKVSAVCSNYINLVVKQGEHNIKKG